MGGEHFGHTILLVKPPYGEIFDEACAIDSGEDVIAFRVGRERGPAGIHKAPPEQLGFFEDQAVGADFDLAIALDRFGDDHSIDNGHRDQQADIDPAGMHGRMMQQIPALAAGSGNPGKNAPQRVAQAQIEILVNHEDAAGRGEKAAIIDMGVERE